MAGSSSTTNNASRSGKRVEAAVLRRARDGSAFTRCEACNKNVPVVLIDLHSCSLDSKIRMNLESQVVEKAVEISTKTDKKRKAPSAGKKGKPAAAQGQGSAKKGKRPQSAFFLFMKDFREEYKVTHPDEKGVAAVGKAGGEKWRSMTDEEKKPYFDQAEELKAQLRDNDNADGSADNNVAEENNVAEAEEEVEQEVDQPASPEDDVVEEAEEEKNELDDDI